MVFFSDLFFIECWRNALKFAEFLFFFQRIINPHVLPGVKQQSYAGNIILKGSFC